MFHVSPIPAFSDNYIWLIAGERGDACAVVDPGDADPVIDRLERDGLTLTAILITHKHPDHVGGIDALKRRWPDAAIYGPVGEPIRQLERRLAEGDRVTLPELGADFTVLDVPGHTEGHIAYLDQGALFCGDTLFAAGCGRVFSGTFEQLSASLRKIARLPADTLCYCAHEYTLDNIGFAKWVEPDSAALAKRERVDRQRRAAGEPTVPSRLDVELATNPFLRTDRPEVIDAASRWARQRLEQPAAVFTALRTWKDREYD